MNSMQVSRRDVDFLLFEWLQVEAMTARDRYSAHSRETFSAALDIYEAIARDKFAPHNKKNDQAEPRLEGDRIIVNPEIGAAVNAFCEAALISSTHNYEVGGMQLPYVVERAGMAYTMAANPATGGYLFLTMANANLVLAHGSARQIEQYARPMISGRFFGTMCLSEPNAGSSLADITTRAEQTSDGQYRLFGNKMWISGGDHELSENIVHLVLAKIPGDDGALPLGVKGISLFLVPKFVLKADGSVGERNDVTVAGLNHKMGNRGTTNCALNFGEGRHQPGNRAGAVGFLLGEAGQGLAYMFHMMNEARIGVGLVASATGYTGYLHALDYARQRRQGRPLGSRTASGQVPIIRHPDVRRMLLAQKAYVEGGLALSLYCSRLVDDQQQGATSDAERIEASQLLDLLTPIAKSWPSEWCLKANDLAIQVHGGYGYTRDFNVEQFYRDNRLNPIHEGTLGIQALDLLGRKVLLHAGASLRILRRKIEETVALARDEPSLRSWACDLEEVQNRVQTVMETLHGVENPQMRLANATAFLEAFGHLVVAWLWLSQAIVAGRALARTESEQDRNFYRGKLQACRYFFHWELPKLATWLSVLDPVDTTCLDMVDEWY
jgi:alkylation response protein AidB-like acyl-CoA dehydrogenase